MKKKRLSQIISRQMIIYKELCRVNGVLVSNRLSSNYFEKKNWITFHSSHAKKINILTLTLFSYSFLFATVIVIVSYSEALFTKVCVLIATIQGLLLYMSVCFCSKYFTFFDETTMEFPIVYTLSTQIWIIKAISVHNFSTLSHSQSLTHSQSHSEWNSFRPTQKHTYKNYLTE